MSENRITSIFSSDLVNQDLAKNYLWQATFVPHQTNGPLQELFNDAGGADTISYRCRTATIPERTIENSLETHWLGSKMIYPGKSKMDGEITLKFDEFQDWKVSHLFHNWMSLIYNSDIGQDGGDIAVETDTIAAQYKGAAYSNNVSDYSSKIVLKCYDSTLDRGSSKDYVLYYAWPKTIASVDLDQSGSDKIERSVTFVYSTFQILSSNL